MARPRIIAITTAMAMAASLLAGCTSTTSGQPTTAPSPSSGAGDPAGPSGATGSPSSGAPQPGDESAVGLFVGQIPGPAPLATSAPDGGDMPEYPEPPADTADDEAWDEYDAQLDAYEDAMAGLSEVGDEFYAEIDELADATRRGGAEAIAAWQTLLVTAGIAVGHDDDAVVVNGRTGSGLPMPLEELRLQALLGISQARIMLTDLADMLGGLGFPVDVEDLREDLDFADDEGFSAVLLALDPDGSTFVDESSTDYDEIPTAEVSLTAAQVSLVLRRLAVEVTMADPDAEFETAAPGLRSTAGRALVAGPVLQDLSGTLAELCKPSESWWVKQLRKEMSFATGKLMNKLLESQDPTAKQQYGSIGIAQAIMGVLALLAKMFMLEADFSLDSAPLVRTKTRTPGEQQNLTVRVAYPETPLDDVHECTARIMSQSGINIRDFQGPAKKVDADLVLTGDRLQYEKGAPGTTSFRQTTNDQGIAVFPLEGAAQPERLPDGAEAEEVTSPVRLSVNLTGAEMWKDLLSAFNDRRSDLLTMIQSTLERMKLVVFSWEVPVRDWTLEADFDMTLTGIVSAIQASNIRYVGISGCTTSVHLDSTGGLGQIDGVPHRVTAKYLTGEHEGQELSSMIFHSKGMSLDDLVIHRNGTEVAYPEFTYDISIGPGPAPPNGWPAQDTRTSGCGDGIGMGGNKVMDCGERSLMGLYKVTMLDGFVYITVDNIVGDKWQNCTLPLAPTVDEVVSPPQSLELCRNASINGGGIPGPATVFDASNKFEISGVLRCSHEMVGSLQNFSFDWKLEFCRIIDDKRAC